MTNFLTRKTDGHVVAYEREPEPPEPGLWIASEWDTHPLHNPDAVHLRHLCVDATHQELRAAIREWSGWPDIEPEED